MKKYPFTNIANQIPLNEKPLLDIAFSFAVARLLAYRLTNIETDIQLTTVDQVNKLYETKKPVVLYLIESYNRQTICNIDETENRILAFFRYFVFLRTGTKLTTMLTDTPNDFTGIGYFVDSETLKSMSENKPKFYKLLREIEPAIEETVSGVSL